MPNPLIDYLERNYDGRVINRWQHYFDIYHRHFAAYRGLPLTVIEIGIFNGGSLRMWRDYFGPQATIVGVDVNPDCKKYSESRIEIVIGDQGDRAFLRSLSDRYPDFAILIDDGGHWMHQQIATFEELYPRLRSDGVYLCEDAHTSYNPNFGGGYQQPQTFIESVKPLIDRLNAFHSLDHSQFAPDDFTRSTNSLHFYDGVVVIEKKLREEPEEVTYGSIEDFKYVAPSLSGSTHQALQRAITLQTSGQLHEAESIYSAILQSQPQHPDANHNLGVLYLSVNQSAAALPFLKVALEANLAHGPHWLFYIEALLATGKVEEARLVLKHGMQHGLSGAVVDTLNARIAKA